MKYVVVAGTTWYPAKGSNDWVGVYDDYDVAVAKAKTLTDDWVRIIHLHPDGSFHDEVWR
jgi:hypothetical protein